MTESVTSQVKLFSGKEKVPEIRLTQSQSEVVTHPRKEKWRYRNVRTILRRLSALTIDKRWHQVMCIKFANQILCKILRLYYLQSFVLLIFSTLQNFTSYLWQKSYDVCSSSSFSAYFQFLTLVVYVFHGRNFSILYLLQHSLKCIPRCSNCKKTCNVWPLLMECSFYVKKETLALSVIIKKLFVWQQYLSRCSKFRLYERLLMMICVTDIVICFGKEIDRCVSWMY